MDIDCGLDPIFITSEAFVVGVAVGVEVVRFVFMTLNVLGELPWLPQRSFVF